MRALNQSLAVHWSQARSRTIPPHFNVLQPPLGLLPPYPSVLRVVVDDDDVLGLVVPSGALVSRTSTRARQCSQGRASRYRLMLPSTNVGLVEGTAYVRGERSL